MAPEGFLYSVSSHGTQSRFSGLLPLLHPAPSTSVHVKPFDWYRLFSDISFKDISPIPQPNMKENRDLSFQATISSLNSDRINSLA